MIRQKLAPSSFLFAYALAKQDVANGRKIPLNSYRSGRGLQIPAFFLNLRAKLLGNQNQSFQQIKPFYFSLSLSAIAPIIGNSTFL